MERKEAMTLGAYRYNTGRACRYGHFSDRYTESGSCITCVRALVAVSDATRKRKQKCARDLINALTVEVQLFVPTIWVDSIKPTVDAMVAEKLPQLDPDAVNPPNRRHVSMTGAVRKLKLRVHPDSAGELLAVGAALLNGNAASKIEETINKVAGSN